MLLGSQQWMLVLLAFWISSAVGTQRSKRDITEETQSLEDLDYEEEEVNLLYRCPVVI